MFSLGSSETETAAHAAEKLSWRNTWLRALTLMSEFRDTVQKRSIELFCLCEMANLLTVTGIGDHRLVQRTGELLELGCIEPTTIPDRCTLIWIAVLKLLALVGFFPATAGAYLNA